MFEFLQKLTHQHPKPKKQQEIIQKKNQQNIKLDPNSLSNQKLKRQQSKQKLNQKQNVKIQPPKKKQQLSLSAQLQMGQSAQLDPEVLQILQRIKDESQTRLPENVLQKTNQERVRVEKKVYLREMSGNFDQYLQQILLQCSSPNRFVRHGLAQIVDHVANQVYEDIILTNKYQITKKSGVTKDQLALLQISIAQIKKNEGSVRDKVGQLKLQLKNEANKINDGALQIISKQSFSINHPKTREVQMFLKSLQMERLQRKRKYQEFLEKKKQKKKRDEQLMQMAREKAKSERHQRLVEVHQIKRKIKQQQRNMSAKKNQQFNQFLKIYKKRIPLYRQKEKQFIENFVKKEQQQRYNKLLKRKQIFAPIQFEDFEDHEQRYMDYKRDNQIRHQAQIKLQKQTQKRREQQIQNLHKGKFRYYVLQQMVAKKQAKDPKEDIIEKKKRQLAYSQNVKQAYKPKIDPMKKYQLQSLLAKSSNRKKYRDPTRAQSMNAIYSDSYQTSFSYGDQQQEYDPKKEGQRNRRYFKQYIRQKLQRGEVKRNNQTPATVTLQPKTNYLQQLRNQRQTNNIRKSDTIDNQIQSIKQKQDIGGLISRVQHNELKLRRLEKKFRNAAHKPSQEADLQDNYLFGIKAKLELLNNYD